jgi:type IV pilus assembly protein PilA
MNIMEMSMKIEKGFTLIELLVVIAIIGILAAIAIPQFAEYRARGFDARAKSDLRNVATAEEAYFVDNEVYKDCDESTCPGLLPGIGSQLSQGVTLAMTATATGFTGTSNHSKGTGAQFDWDSSAGGLQ